jgi:hypothetical protein
MLTLIERIKLLDSLTPKITKWSEWSAEHLPSCRPSYHPVNKEKFRHEHAVYKFIQKSIIQTGEFPTGIIYIGTPENAKNTVGKGGFIDFDHLLYLEEHSGIDFNYPPTDKPFQFEGQLCLNSIDIIDRIIYLERKKELESVEQYEYKELLKVKDKLGQLPSWYNGIDLISGYIFHEYARELYKEIGLNFTERTLVEFTRDNQYIDCGEYPGYYYQEY